MARGKKPNNYSNFTTKDYIRFIKPKSIEVQWPDNDWTRVHGEGKATTTGKFRTKTRIESGTGRYLVKIFNVDIKKFDILEVPSSSGAIPSGDDVTVFLKRHYLGDDESQWWDPPLKEEEEVAPADGQENANGN